MLPEGQPQRRKDDKVEFLQGKLIQSILASKSQFAKGLSPEDKREDARTHVTKNIIRMYVICTGAIIFAGVFKVIWGTPDEIKSVAEALKTLVEFLNVLVLPIITLVLGFYFGSEKK